MTRPAASPRARPWARTILAAVAGIAVAVGIGVLAAYLRGNDHQRRTIVVFTALTAPALIAMMLLLLIPEPEPAEYEHREDAVEWAWYRQACQGAFHDIIFGMGLATATLAITDVEFAATTVMAIIFVFAVLDVFVRYTVAKRRRTRE